MATIALDTCYNERTETIDGVITSFSEQYNITGKVVDPRGPAGGWPIVEWTGTEDALFRLVTDCYDDGSGLDPVIQHPELAQL
jgi:hypothetical protein